MIPTVLYCAVTKSLSVGERRKLEVLDTMNLRKICGIKEVEWGKCIVLKWFGHVERMVEEALKKVHRRKVVADGEGDM